MKRFGPALIALAFAALASACTTGDVLEPPAMVGNGAPVAGASDTTGINSLAEELSPPTNTVAATEPMAPAQSANSQGDSGPVASAPATLAPGAARLQFAPVMGAAPEELAPLNQRIVQRAAERGISVAMGPDPAATHIIKGYFSTLKEGGGNTLIYVWDVFDRSGTRVRRIQGKEAALGQGAGAALRAVADRTVDDLAGWLAARPG
ncbi:MAG TPA: hypothetical protein VMF90_08725 [Rhizobiaceae bacterium]|nr:hypothetical protein [Rhizobiaceae bacterium]